MKIRAVILAIVFIACLSACGCSSPDDWPFSTDFEPASGSSAGAADKASSEIFDSGVLRAGTASGYPPFEFYNEEGMLTGLDIDVLSAVASGLKLELEIIDAPGVSELMAMLEKGEIDVAAAALKPSADRLSFCDFTDVYFEDTQYLIMGQAGEKLETSGFAGVSVAVCDERREALALEVLPGCVPVLCDGPDGLALSLGSGETEAAVANAYEREVWISRSGNAHGSVALPSEGFQCALAVAKDAPGLKEQINLIISNRLGNERLQDSYIDYLKEIYQAP